MRKNRLRTYVYLLGAAILVALLASYPAGWLGQYPVRAAHLFTGRTAFIFLLASLSITPLRTLTGSTTIGPLRKAFGLNAFYFAAVHMLILLVLDYRLNLSAILEAFTYRTYIWPGAAAFLILVVLAVTSITRVKKAVKTAWKKIHMLVYPAGMLVLMHFTWITNGKLIPESEFKVIPLLAALYLAALFTLRLKPVKEAIVRRRMEKTKAQDSSV